MAVQTQIQTRRGTAASWTSTNPTLAAGEFGYETDTGKFKIGNGSTAWAALAYSAGATAVTYLFNATSGQTTFSGTDANGLTLAYTVGAEQVYLNGVLQVRGSDYTATNGTSIVLASGALTSDVLNVIAYSAMTITDTYTQAQADAKFVQQTNNFFAGKNKIINGDFGIWQRGTSFTNPSNGTYVADRWFVGYENGTVTSSSVTQQTFTPGTAPVAGYEGSYFLRRTYTTLGTATLSRLDQKIEDVRSFAGQTVTISYWAKSNASVSVINYAVQNMGTGGSGGGAPSVGGFTLTSSWARYSFQIAIPSLAGTTIGTGSNLEIMFQLGNLSNGATFDLWGVQLEAGSIATPFQTATGTIAGELAACQRYFNRLVDGTIQAVGTLQAISTTAALGTRSFPEMRIGPTVTYTSIGDFSLRGATNTVLAATGSSSFNIGRQAVSIYLTVASGLVAGNATEAFSTGANARLDLSAEL
jgi:hypothetical protein